MSLYLLDTNVIALFDPRRREQAGPVIAWMRRNDRSLFISTVTLIEIEAGMLKLLREGKDKRAGEIEAMRDSLISDFSQRLLAVDAMVALAVARIGEAACPRVIELKDLMIAATARTHGLTVLTRNLRHFLPTGVPAVDPLASLPPDSAR